MFVCRREHVLARMNKLLLSVGAMKAGTTWLYRQLEQHPGIRFSLEKEIHYLAFTEGCRENLNLRYRLSRLTAARKRAADAGEPMRGADIVWYLDYLFMPRTWRWYERRFGEAGVEQYCADFSNLSALLGEAAWVSLLERFRNLRLIYVLRDPLDRLWSHLKFHYQLSNREIQIAQSSDYLEENGIPEQSLIEHSLYARNLKRILRVVPRDQILIVLYDQVESDPLGVLREVESFLDLSPHRYATAKLQRRINASASLARPDWVRERFSPLFSRDLLELRNMNISVPEGWCS
jgi:hypothetical protein